MWNLVGNPEDRFSHNEAHISAGSKGKKKKGTTMALTDFLSDEQGNVQGPGTSYVLANKTMDWAAEMEELDTSKS